MDKRNIQTLKGFRDFLPKQMVVREKVITIIKEVFESFGFDPLQTPTLEYAEVLMGKYGEEADKLLYTFEDRGGRKIGLNYDLTVPLARVLSQYQNLPIPFKRYQIQSSYRAENPQRGRYRQFTQCDVDIVGADSPAADAEIITIIYNTLTKLGFKNFQIRFNSRSVSYQIMEKCGIPQDKWNTTLQTVDKLDKKSIEELDKELEEKGLGSNMFSKINPILDEFSTNWKEKKESGDPYLDRIYNIALAMGVSEDNLIYNPTIVRGLDYYTGPVFETFVLDANIGSIASGGRYDQLIEKLGGPKLSAVGTTLGLDRICDVIEELNLWDSKPTVSEVLVSVFSGDFAKNSVEVAKKLREAGINTEKYLDASAKLEKQFKYADLKGIPYVVIIGPEEAANNTVTLKDLKNRTQETLSLDELISKLAH
jgi:histidyl-tRNA synthetase